MELLQQYHCILWLSLSLIFVYKYRHGNILQLAT